MMRGSLLAGLTAVLLIGTGAVAQSSDEVHEGMQRIDVPEAGLSLEVPADWDHGLVDVREELPLPPGFDSPSLATEVLLLTTWDLDADQVVACELAMYEHVPLTLQEHADWFERSLRADLDFNGKTYAQPFELPIGDSIRVDSGDVGEEGAAWYLFDVDGVRFHFACRSDAPPDDGWMELAWFIKPFSEGEEDGLGIDRSKDARVLTDYWTRVWVVDPLTSDGPPKMMWAWCEMALYLEDVDGPDIEWTVCSLTDDAIDPPELQGEPPAEVLTISGPDCVMVSDYWWNGHDRDVYASAFELSVTPEGKVLSRLEFPPDPLLCS